VNANPTEHLDSYDEIGRNETHLHAKTPLPTNRKAPHLQIRQYDLSDVPCPVVRRLRRAEGKKAKRLTELR
jgi:hypothetical protein